ncbi:MAG: hypothetical protein QOC87_390 [Actinomycetota bacterium]|nr:hypothetical protein [Actinomycetota bacterium]
MRSRIAAALATVAVAVALILPVASASASVAPPAGDISKNVEYVTNVPIASAISMAFLGNTMFVSTVHGLYSFDISDPANPTLLGSLPMYIWENEDMTIDPARKLVFISRDPRGFTSPATSGDTFPYGAVHIIDVSNPHALVQLNAFLVPAGHTSTCVNGCDYLWTGGPYANAQTQPGWTGRPIFSTDIRDPMNPKPCPKPIDTERNDGVTDYAHDVSVDPEGIAWVSGAGGVRGYWTSGWHLDPLTHKSRVATGCDPIPYAGGGSPKSATPSRFMHNSWRDPNIGVDGKKGNVLIATEENVVSDCRTSGRAVTYDLDGSYHGEGWRDIKHTHFRMSVLDTWTPEGAKGAQGCDSAHWFTDDGHGLLAYAFYTEGTRFLDVSDPKNIRQVGYFRPNDANTWASYWHDGYVYVADFQRGIDVLRFHGSNSSPTVTAPIVHRAPTGGLKMNPALGFLCPFSIPENG